MRPISDSDFKYDAARFNELSSRVPSSTLPGSLLTLVGS
jgi:hypothetical protein